MATTFDRGDANQRIHRFLTTCSAALTAAAEGPDAGPRTTEAAAGLAKALSGSTPKPFEPNVLPALQTLDLVDDTPLAQQFRAVARLLPWMPTPRAADDGHNFALAPLHEVRDLGDLIVGLMYVKAEEQYPLHQHPLQELYLTISGQAAWRHGGNEHFRPIGPGATFYNHPNDLHSAIAGPTPLVALYVLWS